MAANPLSAWRPLDSRPRPHATQGIMRAKVNIFTACCRVMDGSVPLKRSPPASLKRLLGGQLSAASKGHGGSPAESISQSPAHVPSVLDGAGEREVSTVVVV